jgi:hypothetical protein
VNGMKRRKKRLRVLCSIGRNSVRGALPGSYRPTDQRLPGAFSSLGVCAPGDIKPKNISIDTLSRAFAGNEIDRVQVYGFAMHMQALAMVAGGSVTVLTQLSQLA